MAAGENRDQIARLHKAVGDAFGTVSFFGWPSIIEAVANHRGVSELELFWQLWDEFTKTGNIEPQPTSSTSEPIS